MTPNWTISAFIMSPMRIPSDQVTLLNSASTLLLKWKPKPSFKQVLALAKSSNSSEGFLIFFSYPDRIGVWCAF